MGRRASRRRKRWSCEKPPASATIPAKRSLFFQSEMEQGAAYGAAVSRSSSTKRRRSWRSACLGSRLAARLSSTPKPRIGIRGFFYWPLQRRRTVARDPLVRGAVLAAASPTIREMGPRRRARARRHTRRPSRQRRRATPPPPRQTR